MKKKIFKVDGMHCTSCALMIESDLEDAGVKASCSYPKELLTVEYDEAKVTEKDIATVVSKAGYSVKPHSG